MEAAATPTFERHLPERRRRSDIRMCHGSCCCCCCCLHTIGALIGAGVAPTFGAQNLAPITYYYEEEDEIPVPEIARPRTSGVRLFWFLSLGAAILGTLIGAVGGGTGIIVSTVLVLLAFPAIQLVCAIITIVCLAVSERSDKPLQLLQMGKIMVGLFVGTVAGAMAMVGIWAVFAFR